MEAQLSRAFRRPRVIVAALAVLLTCPAAARAAGYRTQNFTVDAPTPQLAKEIGDAAEKWRLSLAQEWLGRELPKWSKPCPIKALVAPQLGAGGATSFVFDGGEVFGWDMRIQGSRERVLDSVLPHEITHTIFATHFRQPLPRWADEGACTTVEHHSEVAKQERMLIDFLKTRRGIPFSSMFAMKEYPQDVLPLYAQGHSLARYLIGQRGKRAFLNFLADGMQDENWPRALQKHYQYEHLLALQTSWMDWIRAGRPEIQPMGGTMLASAQTPEPPDGRSAVDAAKEQLAPRQAPNRASAQPSVAGRSVYGERATWTPAKGVPAVPASTASAPPAATGAAAYDAARPREGVWR